jgi:branched-chain amino acid transport system substrate-binding protein
METLELNKGTAMQLRVRSRNLTISILHRSGALLATAALAAGLCACSSNTTASNSGAGGSGGGSNTKTPIVIGASLSLTGDFSADGEAFKKGYELWQSYQNAHGGLLGHQIKLDILNDNSDPNQVALNYQKLATIDHVDLVFGPFSTLLTVPASKVTNRYGYAMIEGAGGAPLAFAQGLHTIFDVSAPVAFSLVPFAQWIASMPADKRPKTAAYPTSNDPFTEPQLPVAQHILQNAGVQTVYFKVFPAEVTDYTPIADAVAQSGAEVVLLGSVDVPTVSAFIHAFAQQHYNPLAFIATAGPDQGSAFVNAVGASNTGGVMVPNAWYPGSSNPLSQQMVAAYLQKYGGQASDINADVAEAYSVGEVTEQAVSATNSFTGSKISTYLHSDVTLQSVQGPVHFNALGENTSATIFVFQWQNNKFVQVLPVGYKGSVTPLYPKPAWGS